MKKKIISLLLITLLILCSFTYSLFADDIDLTQNAGRYYWIGNCEWSDKDGNGIVTIKRYLRLYNDINFYVYRTYNSSTSTNTYIVFYSPEFDNQTALNNWKSEKGGSYINSVSNGNLGSVSVIDNSWTNRNYTYSDNNGNHTKYYAERQIQYTYYFYCKFGKPYAYFYGKSGNSDSIRSAIVCYLYHGIYGTRNINNDMYTVQIDRIYPFVFGGSNDQGDQRNYDDEITTVNTLNIHPEDSFNTYQINRNVSSNTVDFDTYIMPDAVDVNNTVISNSDLRYQDYTYNTEYEVSNVVNYYDNSDNSNNSGDNGGNGSINNSGVTITVSEGALQQQQQQYQTIEENAVNVTVNNNNNLNQDMVNDIDQIINNTSPDQQNTFQTTVQNIAGFTQIGSAFAQLAGTFLSFLPSWVTTLLSITFAIVFFLIVLRIIHLFI